MSQSPGPRIEIAGDRSLLVIFGEAISPDSHRQVLRMTRCFSEIPAVTNVHPAYASVLVDFDPLRTTHDEIEERARYFLTHADAAPLPEPRRIEIPVHYGGDDGPDLDEVARLAGRTPEEVIALHSGADYLVYFLGFSPGFPYLGGMPEEIAVPRLDTPRRRVPAGSVAIGGHQTGVYPLASPGGWRIIGRTPLHLFQPDANPPVLLQMGDHVTFVPMSKD
ncbi:MAG: 5-oxoprolinase subunit PxpB [Bryobacteraceae bacterium]